GADRDAQDAGRPHGPALRGEPDRPDPALAGPAAADPARERAARRPLAGHAGAGRPPDGAGGALADRRPARAPAGPRRAGPGPRPLTAVEWPRWVAGVSSSRPRI